MLIEWKVRCSRIAIYLRPLVRWRWYAAFDAMGNGAHFDIGKLEIFHHRIRSRR